MKKTLTLCTLLVAWLLPLYATDYLAEENEYLLNHFKLSGTPTGVYLNCEQDIVTPQSDQTLHFTFGGNLNWYNVRSKFYNCWYIFSFGKFDIHYKLYYKHNSEKNYKLATQGTEYYIDENIAQHEARLVKYQRTVAAFENVPFAYPISWKLPHDVKTGVYQFKIELIVTPDKNQPTNTYTVGRHYENGSTSIFCPYESAMKYIVNSDSTITKMEHFASSHQTISGGESCITFSNSNKSVLQSKASANPLSEDGYRLVYNHPQAEFMIQLSTDNTPVDTVFNNIKYKGFSTLLAGIGESYQLSDVSQYTQEYNKCYNEKEALNSPNLRYIEFVRYGNQQIDQFLQTKYQNNEYSSSNYDDLSKYGLVRYRNILLQTNNIQATSFNENAVNKLENFEPKNNKWFSRIYHVRDLNFAKLPQSSLNNHTVFKVWNKMYYATKNLPDVLLGMGCGFYGPFNDYATFLCCNNENYPRYFVSENCLMFKLVPQVFFPSLTAQEQAEKQICVSDSSEYLIHLSGKNIVCNDVSPTLYSPMYLWQLSENGTTWRNIEENNPYKINGFEISETASNKDLYLKSGIVKGKKMHFRQICVLKSFASTEESQLYNYPITMNGQTMYYISVVSPHYYTYKEYPSIQASHFAFTHYTWPARTYLCPGDALPAQQISFACTHPQLSSIQDQLHYKIYQIESDGSKKLVANEPHYTLQQLPDSVTYECVIALCKDSISQSVCIVQQKQQKIDLNQIKASVAIGKKDSLKGYLELWCLKGTYPTLSITSNNQDDTYFIRTQVPKTAPVLLSYNWDNLDRMSCQNIIAQQAWPFKQDTGFDIDQATLNQIRDYGKKQQTLYNAQQEQKAIQDSIQSNAWKQMDTTTSATVSLTYSPAFNKPRFYLKSKNAMGCESDSILVDIAFVNPIEGNQIHFKQTDADTVYIPSGQGNPYIVGSYPVTGGYGPVSTEDSITYTYQWMRKSANGQWEPVVINARLYAQVTENGTKIINSGTKYVSLPDETLKDIQENWELARFVYSRKDGDTHTQLVSVSNSLWMMSTPTLDEQYIQVYNADCPGEKISVVIHEPDALINQYTQYVWKISNPDLVLSTVSTYYNNTENKCIIKDAQKDFTLSVYRYNIKTGVRSNTVEIPIQVDAFKSGFTILYNQYEYALNEKLVVPPGSKIQLLNQSANAEDNLNLWVLQIQENWMGDGRINEGTTSSLINPSCYLYNVGQHKIKLTTTTNSGCTETIVAENLFVEGVSDRTMTSYFVTEEPIYHDGTFALQQIHPTLLNPQNGYQVNIQTNKETYTVALYNVTGQTIIPAKTFHGNTIYACQHIASGTYLLRVDNTIYKLIIQ